jgi:hypothetical protein
MKFELKICLIIVLFCSILSSGCTTKTSYICPDNSIVEDPNECKLSQMSEQISPESKEENAPSQIEKKEESQQQPQIETKKCPSSCDDDDKCTYDYCNSDSNFECMHRELERCCSNNICENTDECINCFSDCYECSGHDCTSVNNRCEDTNLYVFTTLDGIRIEVPSEYISEAEWFSEIESNTLQKIEQVYGFGPEKPITFRFVEFDLSDYNYLFNPQSNKIIIPANSDETGLLTLRKYYEDNQEQTLLEVHEMIHAINFAQCQLITYSPAGEEHRESKLPLWLEEGLAMTMELWVPYYYGNEYDIIESRYEPQKKVIIDNWEDQDSNFWVLVNNPSAYGFDHARGSVLLYSWFKNGLTESQLNSFVSKLFSECKTSDNILDDDKIIEIWNRAVGRDDTSLFNKINI